MRFLTTLGVLVSFFLLYSCTGISDEIKSKSTSTRNDVFQDIGQMRHFLKVSLKS